MKKLLIFLSLIVGIKSRAQLQDQGTLVLIQDTHDNFTLYNKIYNKYRFLFETDSLRFKISNGSSDYNSLATINADGEAGAANWGTITGMLSSQTDLQTALNAKLNIAGGTMTGFLTLHQTPTSNFHATTKKYTDSLLVLKQNSLGFTPENSANKDFSGGYVGMTLFKHNFKNAANTITSFLTNSNTGTRTYTFQDKTGTIADLNDFVNYVPYAGATNSINLGIFGLTDNTESISINPNSRVAYRSDGTTVLEWEDMFLRGANGNRSVDWDQKLLYDNNVTTSVNWQTRMANASDGSNALDWENRILVDASSNNALEWGSTRLARDLATTSSIDWDARILYDASGHEAINYTQRKTFDNGDLASSDFDNRLLITPDNRTVLDWRNQQLMQDWSTDGSFGIGAKINSYNGIATISNGVPSEYATSDQTNKSAAIVATTIYAVPSSGLAMYRISWVATITTAASTSSVLGGTSGFQIKYTDGNDNVVKTSNPGTVITSTANTTGTSIGGTCIAYCKASTNLQYIMDYTSVGVTAMIYNLHIKIEKL